MPTQAACAQCGRAVDAGAQFCSFCGFNVSDAQGNVATRHVAVSPGVTAQMHDLLLQQLRDATLGEYEILTELGRGGMATVYLGHDLQLDRRVAVKVMLPSLLEGEGMIDRFKLEARTAAQLSHPHIIPIYAVRDHENLLFFIMKFVEGRPLDSIIKESGKLPVRTAQSIVAKVGEALGYAHRRGVVHRDIKPANLMIDVEGLPVVTDFGIAKVSESRGLTMTGATVGTPHYMSPEQCTASKITGASDQYSLGVVAYEMLSGRLPFQGDSIVSLLYKHVHEVPPPFLDVAPECPPQLHDAIMKMLAKDPDDRFPTMEAAIEAVGSVSLAFDDPLRTKLIVMAKEGGNLSILKRISTPRSPTPVRSKTLKKTGTPAQRTAAARNAAAAAATVRTTPGPVEAARLRAGSRKRTGLWIAVALVVLAAGAGAVVLKPWDRTGTTGTGSTAAVASLGIEPASPSMEVNSDLQLSAAARNAAGEPVATPSVAWFVDDTLIASVSPTGLVTAFAPGRTRISAVAGTIRSTAQLTVAAPASVDTGTEAAVVARLRVDGAPAALSVGETAQLRVTGLDGSGTALPGRPGVTWSSSAPRQATVSRAGLVTALAPGRVTLTARSGSISQQVAISIDPATPGVPPPPRPVRVASIALAPPAPLTVGGSARVGVTVTGDDGRPMNAPLSWRSSDPRVATVADGVVSAIGAGTATITAAAEGREASAVVNVSAAATPVPPPPPPPPPPPAAAVPPEEAIATVIQQYARAMEAGQTSEIRRLYPSMSGDQENQLSQFLRSTENLQVQLAVRNLDVQGDIASGAVSGLYRFRSRENRRDERIEVNLRATFERGPSGWRIRSMR